MKLRIRLAITMMVLVSIGYAQENQSPVYTKDFGFNTYFILNPLFQATQSPFDVILKKYTSETTATRYGIDLQFFSNQNKENSQQSNNQYSNQTNFSIAPSIGKEIQKPISNTKWVCYYGGDIVPNYQTSSIEYYNGSDKFQQNNSSNFGVRLRPFLGIRFNINQRFYLATEATLSANYSQTKEKIETFDPDQVVRDVDGNTISFGFNPAAGLFLFYRF